MMDGQLRWETVGGEEAHQVGPIVQRRVTGGSEFEWGKVVHDRHRLERHGHNTPDQIEDVGRRVVLDPPIVGVVRDAGFLVGGDRILVEHPVERGSRTHRVPMRLRWTPAIVMWSL